MTALVVALLLSTTSPCWPEGYEWLAEQPVTSLRWFSVLRTDDPTVGMPVYLARIERGEGSAVGVWITARGHAIAVDSNPDADEATVYLRTDLLTDDLKLLRVTPHGSCAWKPWR